MSSQFAVVYEAQADFETATELADRVLCESIDWLEDYLDYERTWLGHSTGGQRLTWKAIRQLALDAEITAMGHFDDGPGLPDAGAARRAILFLRSEFPGLDAIVLVRDRDDQPERRGGLEQARSQDRSGVVIVVGFAVVEREAWVISGYHPKDEIESSRLQAERTRLGFDPCLNSHQLTACKDDQAKRSPKRVLRELSGDDRDRERRCWRETSLSVLRERGPENGLAEYLREVRELLAALIGHVPER